MRKILSLLVFSFSFLVSFASTKAEADALYEKEQYKEAAAAYEAVLKNEGVAAEVYYNLGNCYYKQDEIPLAVLNYERAFLLDPGDAGVGVDGLADDTLLDGLIEVVIVGLGIHYAALLQRDSHHLAERTLRTPFHRFGEHVLQVDLGCRCR